MPSVRSDLAPGELGVGWMGQVTAVDIDARYGRHVYMRIRVSTTAGWLSLSHGSRSHAEAPSPLRPAPEQVTIRRWGDAVVCEARRTSPGGASHQRARRRYRAHDRSCARERPTVARGGVCDHGCGRNWTSHVAKHADGRLSFSWPERFFCKAFNTECLRRSCCQCSPRRDAAIWLIRVSRVTPRVWNTLRA